MGFPGSTLVKNWPADAGDGRKVGSIPGQEEPLEQEMATHFSIIAWREFHGQKNLAGYNPWGLKEQDVTKHAHTWHKVDNTALMYWGVP